MLVAALVCLTTYRITKLVVHDQISLLRIPREWIQMRMEARYIRKQPAHLQEKCLDSDKWNSQIAYLLSCPWCMSIWIGGAVTLATDMVMGVTAPFLLWFAASAVTGFLSSKEGQS